MSWLRGILESSKAGLVAPCVLATKLISLGLKTDWGVMHRNKSADWVGSAVVRKGAIGVLQTLMLSKSTPSAYQALIDGMVTRFRAAAKT